MMSKQKSMKSVAGVRGGSTGMFGKQSSGTQVPGQTAQMGSGGGKFASGGSTKMAGKQTASPAKPC